MTRRLFIDMDGVLAVFDPDKSLEEVAMPGYFRNLAPMSNVVAAVKAIINNYGSEYEVYSLSSTLHEEAIQDKSYWLDKVLPELPKENRIFVPYGKMKKDYIAELHDSDILIDDFSKNLREWHGVAIKLMNGINGTKGTWCGYSVNGKATPDVIRNTIIGIALTS